MPSLFPDPAQARLPSTHPNPHAWLIAHCDGGARGNPGPAGYGAVIETESKEKLAELSEFLGTRTNNYAEYSGLLGVLAWALDHGYRRLRVVSDSELMVKQIQGRYKVNSPDLKPLWTEAHSRIAQLEEFQITHALRHKNKDADRLANAAMDRGTGKGPGGKAPAPSLAAEQQPQARASPYPKQPASPPPNSPMLRGFTRGGVVHLLGDAKLPDGVFVKIVPE
ncbi:MAG TPA: ribonuclease HI family protein [Bryocella sp.]|nr:ribonuclease HI family protein [Bryocella sp.]